MAIIDNILFALLDLGSHNPFLIVGLFLYYGGFIPVAFVLLWGIWKIYLNNIKHKYSSKWNYSLLAIDIPKDNEQTPKAVEHIFTHLYSVLGKGTLYDRYVKGKVQEYFSLELISLGGNIQFLIRTISDFRNLVEAAVYAQYPDAEIIEVEDYAEHYKNLSFPSDQMDMFGTELVLNTKQYLPIKTYPYFEHALVQKYADPMAGLLEVMSKVHPSEQLWIQILIKPVSDGWKEEAEAAVNKLIGKKVKAKQNFIIKLLEEPKAILQEANSQMTGSIGGESAGESKDPPPSLVQYLSPGEKFVVEAIQEKLSKLGFKVKIRFCYLSPKNIFNKARGVSPVMGAFLQFNTQNLNGFKTGKRSKTKADYWRIEQRESAKKNRVLQAYIRRDNSVGDGTGFVLNTEELASIYHFPDREVKAPLVHKILSKRAEPPATLPNQSLNIGASLEMPSEPVLASDSPDESEELNPLVINSVEEEKTTANTKGEKKHNLEIKKDIENKNEVKHSKLEPPPNLPIG